MSNITPPPLNSSSTASASLGKADISQFLSAPKVNPGTPIQLAIVAGGQLQLQTANGSISLSAPRAKVPINPELPYVAQLKSSPQSNILEISHRYQQQQLNLTASQSQQVIEQISQNPVLRESNLPLRAKVIAVQPQQIQLSLSGKTISLPVADSAQFKVGQWLSLDLMAGQNVLQTKLQEGSNPSSNQITMNASSETAKNYISSALQAGKQLQIKPSVLELTAKGLLNNSGLITGDTSETTSVTFAQRGQQGIIVAPLSNAPLLKINLERGQIDSLKALDIKTLESKTPISSLQDKAVRDLPGSQEKLSTGPTLQNTQQSGTKNAQLFDNPIISKADILKNYSPQTPSQSSQVSSEGRQSNVVTANEGKTLNNLIKHYQSQLGLEQSKQITQLLNQLSYIAAKHGQPAKTLTEINSLVQQLVQQVETKVGSVGKLREQLQQFVQDLSPNTKLEPNIKVALSETITKVVPEGGQLSNIDASQIKQLLQSSALPMSTQAITAISSQSGFVAGLINLLQVALASRQQRTQPKAVEAFIQQFISSVTSTPSDKKAETGTKSNKELAKLEQRLGLLKLSTDAMGELAHSKLKNIERRLQGQESLHMILPFVGTDNKPLAELSIKREIHEDEAQEKDRQQQQLWMLTMKLNIGNLGEVLCKSSLSGQNLDIEFFTSTDNLKDLVINFAPLLKKRFETLGIDMTLKKCERGVIPDSLAERPYQLFQAKA